MAHSDDGTEVVELEHPAHLGSGPAAAGERSAALTSREEKLKGAADEVERVRAELEDFVYTVSHDLNGPLISILGYADLFETDFGSSIPDEGKFYLERIKASSRFMQLLIADLLELSRVGRVHTEPETVELHALINEIADEIRVAAPEAKVTAARLPAIYLNPVRAKQLFANLIDNSVTHGARPDVTVEVGSGEESDGLVTVSVTDDGPGIPVGQRDKVFGVFQRLDPAHSGTGMGLAICRRIVESNGGSIWIADSDIGTDMRLSLPVATTERSSA